MVDDKHVQFGQQAHGSALGPACVQTASVDLADADTGQGQQVARAVLQNSPYVRCFECLSRQVNNSRALRYSRCGTYFAGRQIPSLILRRRSSSA
jgi:hypothetical protein